MALRTTFLRHPALRWLVPLGVVGAMSMTAAGVFSAQASTSLPPRTAAQLLADIENAKINGLSGTIVSNADLGLPELPALPQTPQSSQAASTLMGLLTGSHTARVWYAGPTKQRFALYDTVGETDVFHNGKDLWQWSSADRRAVHTTLANGGENLFQHGRITTLTPDQLANQALAAIEPSTVVTTDESRQVAGRAAYELVLTPRDTTSRIGSVHIAVDGAQKIPVGVQVYARGSSSPAVDVSFTRLSFSVPSAANFNFSPPSGATVENGTAHAVPRGEPKSLPSTPARSDVRTIGTGWTTVVSARLGDAAQVQEAQQALTGLTRVSGTWGSGLLFDSKLVTALITNDGRIYAGAVDPTVLYAAAK
jgi:outer membrane lipoprotein-sorting protein